jgi:hypothetical protein
VLNLLKKSEPRELVHIIERSRPGDDEAFERIRCPACEWRPSPGDRWCCNAERAPEPPFTSCGTVWNTFATAGRCPGCGHQWTWTGCLRCHEWSRHDDWYECG